MHSQGRLHKSGTAVCSPQQVVTAAYFHRRDISFSYGVTFRMCLPLNTEINKGLLGATSKLPTVG